MWRGSLLPLACEAAPKPDSPFLPNMPQAANYADCVAEQEQAPSPQVRDLGAVVSSQNDSA
ncbi:hypothetical protein PseAD21_24200 [Pseudomonas sp. AD21]|jgi:hypothetical protein|nr:hypothetical protein PseAD21_24200 [Pseudomonas sp. AD21]